MNITNDAGLLAARQFDQLLMAAAQVRAAANLAIASDERLDPVLVYNALDHALSPFDKIIDKIRK
jgi:hypothetical protein